MEIVVDYLSEVFGERFVVSSIVTCLVSLVRAQGKSTEIPKL